MKLEVCIKPRLGLYRVWIADNDTDWTVHLGAKTAGDVAALIRDRARRLRLGAYPEVVVFDEDHRPVPMPIELKSALDALRRTTD
jgi:hypothetical protein